MDGAKRGGGVPQVCCHGHEDEVEARVGDVAIAGCLCPANDGEARREGGAVVRAIGCQLWGRQGSEYQLVSMYVRVSVGYQSVYSGVSV